MAPNAAEDTLRLARLLAARLERLSPDSTWARRASGCRGALLKLVSHMEECAAQENASPGDIQRLEAVMTWGFDLVEKAAREY
jgi:hypothetical protein